MRRVTAIDDRGIPLLTLLLALVVLWSLGGSGAAAESAPGDVVLARKSSESPKEMPIAVFPHWAHRLRFTCNVCHPAIFPMKAGESAISMEDIYAGKACGTCHKGKIAFEAGVSYCGRCHLQQGAGAP